MASAILPSGATGEPLALKAGRVRTPALLQMDIAECGAACLGIVLAHFGRVVPLAELRRACGVSRDGSKASNVLKAARTYGLTARGYKKELHELTGLAYPYIVFWNFNHFVVVEGFRRGSVFLNDPATGPRQVPIEEFDRAFTGVVLAVEPGPDFVRGGRAPGVAAGLGRRVRSSVGAVLFCALVSLLLVLPGLLIPALMQAFVDNVLVLRLDGWARPLIAGLAAATALSGVLAAIQAGLLRRLELRLAAEHAAAFVWHLLRLPADFYTQRYSGEIAGRVALNERTANLLARRLGSAVIDALMMVFYAAAMFLFDRLLTLVAIGFAIVHVLILRWLTERRVDAGRRLAQEFGKLAGVGIAGLQTIRTIKASGLESQLFARLAGRYAKAVNTHQSLTVAHLYVGLLPRVVAALMTTAILVAGSLRVIDGVLTIGMLVAFQSLARSFLAPVGHLLHLASAAQDLQAALTRLDDVLQSPAREEGPEGRDGSGDPPRLIGDVVMRSIGFAYNPVAPPLIRDFSLTMRPGQRIAIVGGSGSGKSTIARLIAGLYTPVAGEILFDGRPRRETPRDVLTRSVALVDQDILLFAGTVRDNLTLWDPSIADDRIVQACRDAAIHDDVEALSRGYDTHLLEGATNLSGGQRQRLEIARALCVDPAVLILDEATSALDAATEHRIVENLRRRACSCVIVAHRLSTIRDADEIIVLDQGRVVQRGTHGSLLAEGESGLYCRLLNATTPAGGHGAAPERNIV